MNLFKQAALAHVLILQLWDKPAVPFADERPQLVAPMWEHMGTSLTRYAVVRQLPGKVLKESVIGRDCLDGFGLTGLKLRYIFPYRKPENP